jgi:hypothetical protein
LRKVIYEPILRMSLANAEFARIPIATHPYMTTPIGREHPVAHSPFVSHA